MSEDISFCMIPVPTDGDKFHVIPHPTEHCHCKNSDKKHFALYGKFNEDRTAMIPSSEDDVKALEDYCKNLNKNN
uniref:Uncharacterized protein n=1 Tax=viral metagenome TaxID=1070528 RepID=A0A6C0LJ93_9ZZZZ